MASICVFCASSLSVEAHYLELAAEVGAELAVRGHTLISGGGAISSMGAVARAARAGGAYTVGVIPRALMDLEVADRDSDELVVTPDMRTRKAEMDARADAFLVLPGGIGTLEELLEVTTWSKLGIHAKPCGVLNVSGYYDPLGAMLDATVSEGFMAAEYREILIFDPSPAALLDRL